MIPRPNRRTGKFINCEQCDMQVYVRLSESGKRFCSKSCFDNSRLVYIPEIVECGQCNLFFFRKEKPKSNSSGKFCSIECRNLSYFGKFRGRKARYLGEHRTGWRKIAEKFKIKNNFCILCGSRDKKLYVHHIEPYRIRQNNSDYNLVSCCAKCHAKLENISYKYDQIPIHKHDDITAFIGAKLEDFWHIHQGVYLENRRS